MMRFPVLILMIGVAGCANGRLAANSCDGFKPIRPTGPDIAIISGDLAGAILAHNEHGRKVCGWTPWPKKI